LQKFYILEILEKLNFAKVLEIYENLKLSEKIVANYPKKNCQVKQFYYMCNLLT
jgi:hypothetical protein